MEVFDLVLNVKDLLLIFLFFLKSSHHKISQFLAQKLSFLPLSFQASFGLADHFFQSHAFFIPGVSGCSGGCQANFIPNGFFAEFKLSDIFFDFCQFLSIDSLFIDSFFEVGIESIELIHHECRKIIELSLLSLHNLFDGKLHFLGGMMFFCSD